MSLRTLTTTFCCWFTTSSSQGGLRRSSEHEGLATFVSQAFGKGRLDDPSFRVLGYPGIATILFMIAAAAGLWLGYDIVGADRAHGRRS